MKKIISTILSIAMLSIPINFSYAQEDYAEVAFGEETKYSNIDSIYLGPAGENVVEVGGQKAHKLGCSDDATRFFRIGINDKFLYEPEGCPVEIDVTYYDIGVGCFSFSYDGLNDTDYGAERYSNAEIVHMSGDGLWKTHTFYIEDMCATNNFEGYDLRLALWTPTMEISKGDIYIKSVRIRKVFPHEPLKLSSKSDYYGNIFGGHENKMLTVCMEDVVEEKLESKISYTVTDVNGKILLEGGFEKASSLKRDEAQIDLNSITEYGVYKLNLKSESKVTVDGEEKEFVNEKVIDFSVINKPQSNSERNMYQYVCTHVQRYGADVTAELAMYAGFGGVRDEVTWDAVEANKGVYSVPEWADDYMVATKERNLDYLWIADYGNPHYDNTVPFNFIIAPTSEEGIKGYANYCAYMAEKYKGTIKSIEIWNEYNIPIFNYYSYDGTVYAKMLKEAYIAIKKVDPSIMVIGGAVAGTGEEFFRQVLEGGGYDYMDAISMHPYDWSTGNFDPEAFAQRIEPVKKLFREYGGEKPIWFSEFGNTTSHSGDSYEVTEDQQSAAVIKVYTTGRFEKLFERNYWYDLQDDGINKKQKEHGFGLVRSIISEEETPLSAKPAFVAMAGMNKFLADAEPDVKIHNEKGLWAYKFKTSSGDDVAVIWTDIDCEQSVSLNLGCESVEVFDRYTNSQGKVLGTDGVFSITAGVMPIYIKGNFTDFKETEPVITQSDLAVKITANDTVEISLQDKKNRNMQIVADGVPGVEVLSIEDMKNGKGMVIFKTTEASIGTRQVPIKVYEGKNLTYSALLDIEVVESVSVSMKTSQVSVNDPNHWRAEVTVKNLSNTSAVSGYCRLTKKDGAAVNAEPIKFKNLRAKDSVTLYMNLETMIKKRNHDLTVEVVLDDGYKTSVTQGVDFTSAKYASKKPSIDGEISMGEWKGAWLAVDSDKRVKQMPSWGGVDDLSFDCNLMWDEENFYVAAIVRDNVFSQNETAVRSWAGDSFQFALENKIDTGNYVVDPNGANVDFTEICAAYLGGTSPIMYRFSSQSGACELGLLATGEIQASRKKGETIYEMSIPWTELFGKDYVFDENTVFGYSMLANDNDGSGRKGWIEYNEGIGSTKNALLFGRMKLMK